MRALVVLLIALPALAGCASTSSPSSSENEVFKGVGDSATVTQTTGAIAGVVVDAAIRPVANATVAIAQLHRNATVDKDGRFQFEGLAPGDYFLSATAKHYLGSQTSAHVNAGEVTKVNVMIQANTAAEPYHQTQHFRGHIDEWLSELSYAAELFSPGTLQCECQWTVRPNGNFSTLVFEADGTAQVPNQGTPATKDGYYWEVNSADDNGDIVSDYTPFPILKPLPYNSWTSGQDVFRVRLTGGATATGSMDYDIYITFFYNGEAPKGWSFIKGSK